MIVLIDYWYNCEVGRTDCHPRGSGGRAACPAANKRNPGLSSVSLQLIFLIVSDLSCKFVYVLQYFMFIF